MMEKKYKLGYTTGVFDMFHIGHLNILRRAKEQCEKLVVGVKTDELCYLQKHKYPIINERERMAIVEAIRYVDGVVPQPDMEKIRPVKELGADVVFVGSDWKGTDAWNQYEEQFASVGADVVYIDHTDGISSTLLREKLKDTSLIGGKIGYTTGVFDMFHVGHLNIIRRAKERCGYLIVGVSTDEVVQSYKNKTPIVPYGQRAAIVDAIRYVDEVVPQTSMNKTEFLKQRHFDVMFHGDEWKGTELFDRYEREFAEYGSSIEYLPHTDGISSSILRDKIQK